MRKWLYGLMAAIVLVLLTGNKMSAEQNRSEQPTLRFAVISDIHVQRGNWRSVEKLKRALADIQHNMPGLQALVVNGDLGGGLPSDYDTLRKILDKAKLPPNIFYTIGNHEYYKAWYDKNGLWNPAAFPNGETELASQQRFLAFTGLDRLYYDRWLNGYHFIMLGSERYRQSDPSNNEDAWLPDEQLEWLKTKLREKEDASKPIFVFLHQPIPHTVAGSSSSINNRAVVQHKELRSILALHPQVILFTGHTHWELKSPNAIVRDQFTMVGSSSVYQPWNENDIADDQKDNQSEGISVEVHRSRVTIQGRDFAKGAWIPEVQRDIPVDGKPST